MWANNDMCRLMRLNDKIFGDCGKMVINEGGCGHMIYIGKCGQMMTYVG
jgi:hypothetical protein